MLFRTKIFDQEGRGKFIILLNQDSQDFLITMLNECTINRA